MKKNESSNFRELKNVVDTLREDTAAGNLLDALTFLCTDNSTITIEAALMKRNLSSELICLISLWKSTRLRCKKALEFWSRMYLTSA
jgi:hypothetical protein